MSLTAIRPSIYAAAKQVNSGVSYGVNASINGIKVVFGEGFGIFSKTANVVSLLNLGEHCNSAFKGLTGRVSLPGHISMVSQASELFDVLSIYSTANMIAYSTKFAKWNETGSDRIWKARGIKLLAVTEMYGVCAFLDRLGFINLSKIAAGISSKLRLPNAIASFSFSVVALGCATVGFALLCVDKALKTKRQNAQANRPKSAQYRRVAHLKILGYLLGAVGAGGACVVSALSTPYLATSLKVVGATCEVVKLGRAMYQAVNKTTIKA